MRELIKEFVKIVSETIPIKEPIVEFGSLQVQSQEVATTSVRFSN